MARSGTTWQDGKSGNPKGRPPKPRALAALLAKAGKKKVPRKDGKPAARNQVVAEMAWAALTTGKLTFPDGTERLLDVADWREFWKFVHVHVDGPAQATLDLTSGGEVVPIVIMPVPARGQEQPEPYEGEDDGMA